MVTVRMSHAPKHVRFVFDPDTMRVRATFIHNNNEVDWKWLTADEETCITAIHPDLYLHDYFEISLKELQETDFYFDTVDGDECNFLQLLRQLSDK